MNRGFSFAVLAFAASAALAANTVSPTFLWDGSTDTTGRVITGSPEETSGYWFTYNDPYDHGQFIFPPEFDLNTYGSYPFGLMAEEYGGIKLKVALDKGYDGHYPYVGLGFNIWNEDQEGVDIMAWGGICLEYSSEFYLAVIVGPESDKNRIDDSEVVTGVGPTGGSLKVVNIPWTTFSNPYDLPIGNSQNPAFTRAATIKLEFQEGNYDGQSGEFFLKKIGSLGQCESDSVTSPHNGESRKVNPTFLWDGSTDTEGRGVITGSPEEFSGWWYEFRDDNDGGNTEVKVPVECELGIYTNYFVPMFEAFGGIKSTIIFGEGYEYPYAGYAFNIWDIENSGVGHGVDISEWGGFCLEYTSELDFYIELGVENEGAITGYNYYKAPIKSSSDTVIVEVPWAKFSQEPDLGKQADMDSVLAHAAIVKLKFEGKAGTKGDFLLKKMGSLGQCSGGSDAVKPAVNSQVNVSLSGRTVNFGGVVASAKVSVMDLQGHIVKSATAASAMDLRELPAGTYMLRVQGHGMNYLQKVILK